MTARVIDLDAVSNHEVEILRFVPEPPAVDGIADYSATSLDGVRTEPAAACGGCGGNGHEPALSKAWQSQWYDPPDPPERVSSMQHGRLAPTPYDAGSLGAFAGNASILPPETAIELIDADPSHDTRFEGPAYPAPPGGWGFEDAEGIPRSGGRPPRRGVRIEGRCPGGGTPRLSLPWECDHVSVPLYPTIDPATGLPALRPLMPGKCAAVKLGQRPTLGTDVFAAFSYPPPALAEDYRPGLLRQAIMAYYFARTDFGEQYPTPIDHLLLRVHPDSPHVMIGEEVAPVRARQVMNELIEAERFGAPPSVARALWEEIENSGWLVLNHDGRNFQPLANALGARFRCEFYPEWARNRANLMACMFEHEVDPAVRDFGWMNCMRWNPWPYGSPPPRR